MQNVDFLKFFRTYLLWSKNRSFLSRISKNVFFCFFWLKKKNIWEKGRFFDKNNGLTPLQNVVFFRLCENFTFEVQKTLFSIQNIKKCFFLAFFAKKKKTYNEKGPFFDKKHGKTLFQNVDSLEFYRTFLFWSKKHFFLSRTSKNVAFLLFAQKKIHKKKVNFLTKTMD